MNKRISQYQRIGNFVVYEPSGVFLIFGENNHDAVVVSGSHRENIVKSKSVCITKPAPKLSHHDKSKLISFKDRFWNLSLGNSVAGFSILSESQERIREAIKLSNATHIEFNCGVGNAQAFVFDICAFDGNVIWRKSFISGSNGIFLANHSGNNATFVMKADTFLSLPNETYSVSIFKNDYAIFSSTRDGTRIYIRDQNIRKPFTTFVSDRLEKQIIFSFHPKS